MAEKKKWKTMCNGKVEEGVKLPEPVRQAYGVMLEGMLKHMHEPLDPPKDFADFQIRVMKFFEEAFEQMFGWQHYIKDQNLRGGPTIDNFLRASKALEKQSIGGISMLNLEELFDGYKYLKLALEKGYNFTLRSQYYLGFFINKTKINNPQRQTIGVQAAAQILWYLKKGNIPFATEMRKEIWHHKSILSFLEYIDPRTGKIIVPGIERLEKKIAKVNPLPEKLRRGWHTQLPRYEDKFYSGIRLIPGIFSDLKLPKVNFIKLRIAIYALAKIQAILGLNLREIKKNAIFHPYKEPLKYYLKDYVDDWIQESVHSDRTISSI